MQVEDIKQIGIIGAGYMGQQIALLCALYGYRTICVDVKAEALERAVNFINVYLPTRIERGQVSPEQAEKVKENLTFTTDLREGAAKADFIIETVTEKLTVKREVMARLAEICPEHTIVTTNSSFIVSSKVADCYKQPAKVCNLHFANPVLPIKIVEVVQGPHTAEETALITYELSKKLDRIPIWIKKEIYGFVFNRMLKALLREALYLLEEGIASVEEIDLAAQYGLGHALGPFRIIDNVGIDLMYLIDSERYRETGNPADKPSKIIEEKFKAGEWGRKTGKGFYSYGVNNQIKN